MKKLLSLIFMAFIPIAMMAYDVEVNGIYYNLNSTDNTASVTNDGTNYYTGDVVIPATIVYEGVTYNVTTIEGNAFDMCSGLTSITIPNSVTSMGYCAFNNCTGLTSIDIPNSVTSIGEGAFFGCSGLTSITVAQGNTAYDSRNNCNAIIETSSNTLIVGCQNTNIPNSVTSIGDCAFQYCSGLTSITIPGSVERIGECAFYDCSNLTSINIPSSVTSIGYAAFAECTSLPVENGIRYADTYLVDVLDNSLTDYQIKEGTRFIGDYTFYQNPNLTSITIPNSVISIGAYVFSQCVNLASINIPSSVIKIGGHAISECTNLTSINIPDNVTSIGDGAFSGCTSLPVVDNIRYADTYLVEAVDKTLTTYNIKQGTRFIGTDAFSGCTNLSSITIPNGVTRFGFWSFNECTSLESITIPSSTNHIETSAFRACSSLSSISIPSSVTYIGGNPFEGCYNLTSIIVDSNNPLYDSRNNCNAIIETAANKLISGCMNTIIPNDVTRLGGNAFAGITGISIDIPESVTEIDGGAFAFLISSINTVVCRAATPPTLLIPDVFCATDIANATLMVPATSIDAYRAAEIWKDFGTITSLSTIVTANSYEREYGDENPEFEWTEEGASLDGTPNITCAATGTSAPGDYEITITRGTETNADVTYVNGTLTVTKAPLTITAKSYTIKKGEALPTFEVEYEGFKNDETENDLDLTGLTISCAATDSNTPGSYDITVSGATSSNYDITMEDGKLNIREKEGMADDGNGIYMPWGQNSPWQMTYVYQSQDTGTPPDADWYKTTFDDSEWGLMTGPVDRANNSYFGLGSFFDVPDEGCALYLRRTFDIDAAEYANMPDKLIMKFIVDDWAHVYLNGKFLGTNYVTGCDPFFLNLIIDKNDFKEGNNLLAIYYHDLNFTAYLDYSLMTAEPSNMSPYTDNQGITYELDGTQTAWTVTGMNWNESQTSIDIPGTLFGLPVTTVNESVFNGHDYITSITLNEGLTTIHAWAFYGTGITSINIPASVTEIVTDHDIYGNYQPANPFGGCNNLTTITVDANNTIYSSPSGSNAIIETATNKLVVGCKGTDMAKLPNVTEIGYAAFHDLTELESFTIPDNITTIGEGAFYGCSNLAAVTVESTTPINISGMSYPPFDGTKKYKLYVPVGTKADYQAADGWNEFKYIWEIGDTEVYPAQGYAYFDASTGTLTFTSDDQYLAHGSAKVFLDVENGDANNNGLFEWSSDWDTYYNVSTVVFDPSFANVKPTSTNHWFAYMENLTSIQGLEYLNTSEVTNMRHMFYQCRQLPAIDVSKFNTSKVTDMSHMFRECSNLTSLDLWNFNTSNVVDFGEMFKECSSLNNLDISSFVTSSAEDMEEMFRECYSLTDINLSHFDVTNVTDMHYMFYNCSGLTSLTLPIEMDKLINFSSPCYNVGQWGSAPCLLVVPSDFNFNGVDISQSPFCWADGYFNSSWEAYAELDANSKLTFYFDDQRGNRTGTTYDIDGSYTGNGATSVAFDKSFANYLPSSTAQWFKDMTTLTSISGLENLITWNVYDMNEMFSGCSSLESIDMSNFDVSNAAANGYTSHMFYGCSGLKELLVSESMCDLASDACDGVGTTTEPCELNVPENFYFQGVGTTGGYFNWKAGYFKLATEETITITSAGMATYCSRRDLDFSKVTDFKAYIATGYNRTTGNVIVQPVNDAPAGTGLYLKGAPGTYKVPYAPSGSYYVNMLVGVTEPTTITPTDGDLSNLLLRNGSQGLGFYGFTNETYTVGANKAYLQIPTSMMQTAGANYIGLEFEEGMTGIDTSSMVGEATEGWFSIDGRKLNGKPTRKGVYVNNGRKIVIK